MSTLFSQIRTEAGALTQNMGAGQSTTPSLFADFNSNVSSLPGGLQMGLGVLKGGAQLLQGFQEEQQYSNEAALMEESAQLANYNAGLKVMSIGNRASEAIGEEAASAGASGVTPGGSPGLAAAATVNNAEAASTAARFQGRVQAASDLYQAQVDQWMGQQAAFGGILNGGMSILSSAAMVAAM